MYRIEPGLEIGEYINWCHQCFQLLTIDQSIDLEEFRRLLNVDNIDYRQLMADNQDKLSRLQYENAGLYIQRVIDLIYT